ncbi:bifunctional anthranilate synthase component I family protein/class IV aminotransferase [Burkholderia oklahomensis]|uniref:bifunctional anthranilate synthase component I family protein/class IV aminotransferase n=1 Tax=Burkholderia oklahomensis TaxID=342113 RepID=UPI0026524D8C|nr:bifunctional anthranilate synthase component I family protein/class IV aminotransferase [Burkholderia oklahomensis]MDN7671643.1 bifunctional anthranilate synthase component I family protein/class IV aminotransferase [Burkholderia oklahomensis]
MTDESGAVFALFDDCGSTAAARSSRLYLGFLHERVCVDPAELDAVCAAVADDARQGLHAVVLGDYEFGRDLQLGKRGGGALRFLLFSECAKLSCDEADAWLAARDGGAAEPSAAGVAHVTKSVTRDAFDAAIAAVHDALRAGDSYQINYTYRLRFDAFGAPLALYRRLRARQPVRYGALIALPGDAWVVSCSPELFVEKSGALLRARPMKGTAPRSDDPRADAAAAEFLANDAKNRAENVMIVDLLRNDLARIARTGSVTVPALFSVEPYASVWQMTSTVEAGLVDGATFADVLRALFPCGSITGAPKHRTMQLIDAIETTPRGLYTGAIGWLDAISDGPAQEAPGQGAPEEDSMGGASKESSRRAAPGNASSGRISKDARPPSAARGCGDFCLSVAIRTLTLDAPAADSRRCGTMGVGAGIVLDSVAADEYAECELKARFLTDADPGFQLFETMYATRDAGVRHLDRHLARLRSSADALGFAFDEAAAKRRIDERCAQLGDGEHRVRVALAKDGMLDLTAAPLAPLAGGAVGVLLAPEHGFAPMRSGDVLLAHKTTRRADYDRAWKSAETRDAFDMLFFNERGELTEGGRTNVFVKLDGRWFTPPLSSGVLPGVMRGVLLADPALQATERVLTLDDLLHADALMLANALRGAVPARLVRGGAAAA